MDIARGIGERDGEAFSDRHKTGLSDDPGFDLQAKPTRANDGSVHTGVIPAA
jgi:hypothetical protein